MPWAQFYLLVSQKALVDIFSTRDPVTGDLLFTIINGWDCYCVNYIITLHMWWLLIWYIHKHVFCYSCRHNFSSTIPTSICISWPSLLMKVLCSRNLGCYYNVSNIVEMKIIARTILFPLLRLSTSLWRISSEYGNQLPSGKRNAALKEQSKHLSCLALKR